MLLFTGWQDKCLDKVVLNPAPDRELHFPSFGIETTQFLISECQISGVEINTYGVDCAQDQTFAIWRSGST